VIRGFGAASTTIRKKFGWIKKKTGEMQPQPPAVPEGPGRTGACIPDHDRQPFSRLSLGLARAGTCIMTMKPFAINTPGLVLFVLMSLFLFRLVLRRALLASCAYLAVWTVVMTFFLESHPVLGWFAVGIQMSLGLWVYLRLGFLAGIVLDLTFNTLTASPLTTNFSAWYAGNGLAAVAFLFASVFAPRKPGGLSFRMHPAGECQAEGRGLNLPHPARHLLCFGKAQGTPAARPGEVSAGPPSDPLLKD
jgi:hypothetical protein